MTQIFQPPRLETFGPRVFVGPIRRYDMASRSVIPDQWRAYNQAGVLVPGADKTRFYGVSCNFDPATGMFDYLVGQEVAADATLPSGFGSVTVQGAYACFATLAPISGIQAAMGEIYGYWMTQGTCHPRPGATVEYYPPSFDPVSGQGGYEVWAAVQA